MGPKEALISMDQGTDNDAMLQSSAVGLRDAHGDPEGMFRALFAYLRSARARAYPSIEFVSYSHSLKAAF